MDKDLIDDFLKNPNWPRMEKFIASHFQSETDIDTIDTTLPSEVVHAEIIARQRIARDLKILFNEFEKNRSGKVKNEKLSYE